MKKLEVFFASESSFNKYKIPTFESSLYACRCFDVESLNSQAKGIF